MGIKRTLAELQAEAEGLYGNYELDLGGGKTLVLLPILRLSEDKQNKAYKLQARMQELMGGDTQSENAAAEVRAALHDLVRLVAATKAPAEVFIKAHGHDVVLLMALLGEYREATQLGEASPSSD